MTLLHAPIGTRFEKCEICGKQTPYECKCGKWFCYAHIEKHTEGCEA